LQKGVDKILFWVYTVSRKEKAALPQKGEPHEKDDVRHVHDVRNDDGPMWGFFCAIT